MKVVETPQEMYDLVLYQAGAVEAFARAAAGRLHHVKCHGALYNMAANDEALSEAMAVCKSSGWKNAQGTPDMDRARVAGLPAPVRGDR